jgi:hypothetical protein
VARTDDSLLAKQQEATQIEGQAALFDPVESALPEPLVAVPVRDEAPAQSIARCVTLGANNPVLPLLPQDPRRRGAVVLAVDNDVYIAGSADLAQAAQGSTSSEHAFYLPAGIGIPVAAKGALWVAVTTTATLSRVSVLIAKDDL